MDFMPPEKRTIIKPDGGWKPQTYYVVEAAFTHSNPIHRYIFFSGFINSKGDPSGYNEIYGTEGASYSSVHYIKAVDILAYEDLHDGVTKL